MFREQGTAWNIRKGKILQENIYKQKSDRGSGVLLRWLLERDLVDELNLRISPVIVGDGLRLFPERGPTHDLELVESRATSSGVLIQTFRPNGRATFGNAGA